MAKLFWLFGVVILIGALGYLSYQSNGGISDQTIKRDAESFIAKFNDYGEQIEIYKDLQPPKTEIVYVEKIVPVEVVQEDGSVIIENQTQVVEVEKTSEVTAEVQDRQSQKYKVCVRGHQCDVTGKITLIDPITKNILDPPYGFNYIIRCIESFEENLKIGRKTCESFEDRSETIISFGDRTFAITFTTDRNDPLGIYEVEINVNSKFTFPVDTNHDGIFDSEKPEVRKVLVELKLVE